MHAKQASKHTLFFVSSQLKLFWQLTFYFHPLELMTTGRKRRNG